MEERKGKCINFGECSKADNKEDIPVPIGRDLKCPECGKELEEMIVTPPFYWRRWLMIGVPVVIVIIAGIFLFGREESPTKAVNKTEAKSGSAASSPNANEPATPPLLTSLSIKGAPTVGANTSANYSAIASYQASEAKEVEPNWSVSPDTYASISAKGVLTTKSVPSDQNITITAEYSEGGVTQKATTSVALTNLPGGTSSEPKKNASAEIKKLSAELNFQQGMNYVQSEDYGNAVKEFTAAIDKFPDYGAAYSNRAVAYMQQKKYNLASDDLKKAAELNPTDPNVYYNLTALYSLQKQLDLALEALDKALGLGFDKYDSLRKDPDLKNLRKNSEYHEVLEKHKIFLK